MPVAQPSEWQRKYSQFNREQLGLLAGESAQLLDEVSK